MSKKGKPFDSASKTRITSSEAKQNGGKIEKGSFAAKVQSKVDKPKG